jgi:hypothetical protein
MAQVDGVQAACKGSLLVSIPKAGTHMVLKLYGRAGYLQMGWGEIDPSALRLPREELQRDLLQNPSFAAIVEQFSVLKPEVIFGLLEHHARTEVGDAKSRTELLDGFPDPAVHAAWREIRKLRDRTLFVPRLVVSTHVFSWTALDRPWTSSDRFLAGWGYSGVPSIVYVYRDPRAQIISMIRFLVESELVARHPMVQVYRPILRELQTMDRMLSFAISDPAFPWRDAYRQNRWLLYHPHVLKLRFEDLVGEEGGGSRLSQEEAIERWATFLAVDVPTETLSEGLFGDTKTFRKGRVDSWRDVFKEHHLRAFEREFGDVLADYGYAE